MSYTVSGDTATLTWTTQGADSCELSIDDAKESVPVNGSKTITFGDQPGVPVMLYCTGATGTSGYHMFVIKDMPDLPFDPGQLPFDPGQIDPSDPSTWPFDPGQLPFDPGQLPFDPGQLPFDPGQLPFDPGQLPTDPGQLPFDPGQLPFDPGQLPFDPGQLPGDPGGFPGDPNGGTPPVVRIVSPTGNASINEPGSVTVTVEADLKASVWDMDPEEVFGVDLFANGKRVYHGSSRNAGTTTYTINMKNLAAGSYTLLAKAQNSAGKAQSTPVTLTVAPLQGGNHPPIMTKITDQALSTTDRTRGQVQLRIQATDPDGDALTYTARALPMGGSFDAATQTFTMRAVIEGNYYPEFTATDPQGLSSSQVVWIKVSCSMGGAPCRKKTPKVQPLTDDHETCEPEPPPAPPTPPAPPQEEPTVAAQGDVTILHCGANHLPTVTLTSPPDGHIYPTVPATIVFKADAMDDPDEGTIGVPGKIDVVEFYQGTVKLGEDTTAPYGVTWTNVQAGDYALSAKAMDNAGAIVTSNIVHITVKSTSTSSLPSVAITAPANGSTLGSGDLVSVMVSIKPAPAITKVMLKLDNSVSTMSQPASTGAGAYGQAAGGPARHFFDLTNLRDGSHTLSAVITTTDGRTFTSAPVRFIISPRMPKELPALPPIPSVPPIPSLPPVPSIPSLPPLPDLPTPPATPTPPAQPGLTLEIKQLRAMPNPTKDGKSELVWAATGAAGCHLKGGALDKDVPVAGHEAVTVTAKTTYTLTCKDAAGKSASKQTTVELGEARPAPTVQPTIRTFRATPNPTSGKTMVSWYGMGATTCHLAGDGLDKDVKPVGTEPLTISATTDVTLSCSHEGGTPVSQTVTITFKK
jgi:hypothetical protein